MNESTIRRWISKGILPAKRIGPRLIQIERSDLDALAQPISAAQPTDKAAS